MFNPILPMTYSVEGLKAVISEGDFSLMWQDSAMLAMFLLGSVILTIIYFSVALKKRQPINQDHAA